ncbi:ankyrin repeat-containing domain protein [Coprinopsis sp. MPI-PUGE-AT-0042]|nr:ankyrin repeat-containing domain protein [Coprinopsis sp. MPI-PUGE-AT-0042]
MEILNSLPLPNFRDIQLDTHSKATEGTCIWFTTGEMFLFWIANGKILWGIGIPGAGKTILASIAILHLEVLEETSGGIICVAFVYLRYSEPLTIRDVFESLVKQIVERHWDLVPTIEGLYAKHKRERTKPSQQDLMGVLAEFIRRGKSLFFVLDALDEMRPEDRPVLVRLLGSLGAKLFITSRPLEVLQRQFPHAEVFNIAARPSDLDLHIKDFLQRCPEVMALLEGTDLEERIIQTVHRKSGGMFLHAKLQLEALRQCISALDLEETLEQFPTDIEAIYMKTWERILAQAPKHMNLAKLVLLWVTHAHGEMRIDTLRRAVATSPETHTFEPKRTVPEALLLSVCCGLVSVDERTRLVRLMHYTTRDAIAPRILEVFPVPHAILAHVCIAHLIKSGFQNYIVEDGTWCEAGGFNALLRHDTLLAYAHQSWGHHTRQCGPYAPVRTAATELVLNCTQYPSEVGGIIELGGPLHVAVLHDLEDLILPAARLQSPNSRTTFYRRSPLMLAIDLGHLACAKALLSLPGVNLNLSDTFGRNALMHAVDFGGRTALSNAVVIAANAQIEVVKLLLGIPGIDINLADKLGRTTLMLATLNGRTDFVRLLLGFSGICINAVDGLGWTALLHAMRSGRNEVVKLLLGFPGVDINAEDVYGRTALLVAMQGGYADIVKQLLDSPGIVVNALSIRIEEPNQGLDPFGRRFHRVEDYPTKWTALIDAAHNGRTEFVKLLLNAPGIDVNVASAPDGLTALSHAYRQGHREIVDLLLSFPGTIVPSELSID